MFNLDIYPALSCFILKIKPVILYCVKKTLIKVNNLTLPPSCNTQICLLFRGMCLTAVTDVGEMEESRVMNVMGTGTSRLTLSWSSLSKCNPLIPVISRNFSDRKI